MHMINVLKSSSAVIDSDDDAKKNSNFNSKSRDESVKSNVMESENKHAQLDVDIDVHRMSSVDVEELFIAIFEKKCELRSLKKP